MAAGSRSNDNGAGKKQETSAGTVKRNQRQKSQFCQNCGAWRGELGLEPTPELYVKHLVMIFEEVKRVLTDDGTLWLNLGDSYVGGKGASGTRGAEYQEARRKRGDSLNSGSQTLGGQKQTRPTDSRQMMRESGLKQKDLIGIPWMTAFALRASGWYLRSEIIWCLSGGTKLYARTQKGDMPITIDSLVRLRPETIKLWNGEQWTQVTGYSKSKRTGNEIELTLRSGEKISCTPDHKWPTKRGVISAKNLVVGDKIESCLLPESDDIINPRNIPDDMGWFVGLFLAEGYINPDGDIHISSHINENERFDKLKKIATDYGSNCRIYNTEGKSAVAIINSKILASILTTYIYGDSAHNKHLTNQCWKRSNTFLSNLLDGYLSGDGGWDDKNNRWRLGFTRNHGLANDLRSLCARLGYFITLTLSSVKYKDKEFKTFRGEIRYAQSNHFNNKDRSEIISIKKSRARDFYDIGVADKPNLFALASGTLTHNSKPNPMVESVKDRPTVSHETIFLLTKSKHYYYDWRAITEPVKDASLKRYERGWGGDRVRGNPDGMKNNFQKLFGNPTAIDKAIKNGKNKRSVWRVNAGQKINIAKEHYATYPMKLIEPCVLAGSTKGDIVLDPFAGTGTTLDVALRYGRRAIGIELNPKFADIINQRLKHIEEYLI